MKKRKEYLDIAKGIGIILVVWAHANGPFTDLIYQFHMPFFFFVSGMLFKKINTETNEEYICKKIKSLYVPFVFWNIIVYFFEYLIELYVHNNGFSLEAYLGVVAQIEAGLNKSSLLGATWFLSSLFWIAICYKFLYTFLKTKIKYPCSILLVLSAFLTCIAFNVDLPYFLSRTLICGLFYSSGVILSEIIEKLISFRGRIFIAFLFVVFFYVEGVNNYANMSKNDYGNIIGFLIGAYCASIALIIFSKLLDETKLKIKVLLCYIGKNSMDILIWQFIAFVPIVFVHTLIDGFTIKEFLDFILYQHIYVTNHMLWFLYTVVGVGLPLLIRYIIKKTQLFRILKKLYLVR